MTILGVRFSKPALVMLAVALVAVIIVGLARGPEKLPFLLLFFVVIPVALLIGIGRNRKADK